MIITHDYIPSSLMHTLVAMWLLINKHHVEGTRCKDHIPSIIWSFYISFWEHMRHVATWLVFPSSRGNISRSRIKPPTISFGFGYLSTIIRYFRVISDCWPFPPTTYTNTTEIWHPWCHLQGRERWTTTISFEHGGNFLCTSQFLFSCMIASNDHTVNNLLSHRV